MSGSVCLDVEADGEITTRCDVTRAIGASALLLRLDSTVCRRRCSIDMG